MHPYIMLPIPPALFLRNWASTCFILGLAYKNLKLHLRQAYPVLLQKCFCMPISGVLMTERDIS